MSAAWSVGRRFFNLRERSTRRFGSLCFNEIVIQMSRVIAWVSERARLTYGTICVGAMLMMCNWGKCERHRKCDLRTYMVHSHVCALSTNNRRLTMRFVRVAFNQSRRALWVRFRHSAVRCVADFSPERLISGRTQHSKHMVKCGTYDQQEEWVAARWRRMVCLEPRGHGPVHCAAAYARCLSLQIKLCIWRWPHRATKHLSIDDGYGVADVHATVSVSILLNTYIECVLCVCASHMAHTNHTHDINQQTALINAIKTVAGVAAWRCVKIILIIY